MAKYWVDLLFLQARGHIVALLKELRTGDASTASCPPEEALLQQARRLQVQMALLLERKKPHLQAAVMFKDHSVAVAVQVGLCCAVQGGYYVTALGQDRLVAAADCSSLQNRLCMQKPQCAGVILLCMLYLCELQYTCFVCLLYLTQPGWHAMKLHTGTSPVNM